MNYNYNVLGQLFIFFIEIIGVGAFKRVKTQHLKTKLQYYLI